MCLCTFLFLNNWDFHRICKEKETNETYGLSKTRNERKLPETCQNKPKSTETSRNHPKPAEMTQKKFRYDPKPPKISKLGKSTICYQLLIFKLRVQMPKFGLSGPKSFNFLILAKFRMYSILNVLILKFIICLWKFWAQMPNVWLFLKALSPNAFGHFGPKSISSLILTKFRMYHISKVLISNLTLVFKNFEPKSPNLGILSQKVSAF